MTGGLRNKGQLLNNLKFLELGEEEINAIFTILSSIVILISITPDLLSEQNVEELVQVKNLSELLSVPEAKIAKVPDNQTIIFKGSQIRR